MQKMPINKFIEMLNNAKTDGALEVSFTELNISYGIEPKIETSKPIINGDKKSEYKQYLINTGKTPNVANTYVSGLIAIGNLLQTDIWEMDDVEKVNNLIKELPTNNEFKILNIKRAGSPNAALKRYAEFLSSLTKITQENSQPSRVKGFFKNRFFK
jgi:hypothetical protein